MNSKLMNSLGLGNADIGIFLLIFTVLIFIMLVMIIVLTIEHNALKKRYLRFSQGRDAQNLEKEIGDIFIENAKLRDISEKNKRDIRILYKKQERDFQKVGLVKYDAFSQMGGKLSFSLAMLDEKNNGFILNSVHGTDGCYTYSKEIKAGKCNLLLGEEEKNALDMAMQE